MIAVNIGVQTELTRDVRGADNVLSRSPRARAHPPPRSKSTTLPRPLYFSPHESCARTCPHRSTNRPRERQRSKGRAGCAAARQNVRTEWLRKHRIITTPDLEENRRVSRYSDLSRDLVLLVVVYRPPSSLAALLFSARRRFYTRVIYRAKEETADPVDPVLTIFRSRRVHLRTRLRGSRDDSRDDSCLCVYSCEWDVNQLVRLSDHCEKQGRWTLVLWRKLSVFWLSSRWELATRSSQSSAYVEFGVGVGRTIARGKGTVSYLAILIVAKSAKVILETQISSNALRFNRSREKKNRKKLFSGLYAHTRTRVYANTGGCCVRAPRAIYYDERWKRACAGELNGHVRHLIRVLIRAVRFNARTCM